MPDRALVTTQPIAQVKPARPRRRGKPPVATPLLSVVIVNFCQWEYTAALVRQILRTPAARRGVIEVVVVDNHSPPHPLAARMRRWPGVALRRWGRNRGFARAVNEGCRLSQGSWFLLLNPDVTLGPAFLDGVEDLINELNVREQRAGIVGFQLQDTDGTRQLSSGCLPTLASTLTGLLLPRGRRKYRWLSTNHRCRVPWVSGCCLLVRRQCLEELGGLDESFYLYYEDVDLCQRARARGWSVWYEPSLRVAHHEPIHRRQVPPAMRVIARHALLTYGSHHWPAWQFGVLTSIVRLEAWARRLWARCRRDQHTAGVFTALGQLARKLSRGQIAAARQQLVRVVQHNDPRRAP